MNLSRRKFLQSAALGTVALAVPLLSSCKENEVTPTSPINTIPNPPTNLQVEESLRYVLLSWEPPQTNTDGSPLTDLNAYKIFRKILPNGDFQFVFEIERSGTVFIDADLSGNEAIYQVIAKTKRGALSESSTSSPSARAQMFIRAVDIPSVGLRSLFNSQGTRVTEPTAASVSVERLSNLDFLSLELTCTHAGCGGMNSNGKLWICRCHGSSFDNQGNVVQPPATTPLLRLRSVPADNGDLFLRIN